jgi:hypothetical protein
MGITIRIIIGGRITTGIICIRIKMGTTVTITMRSTIISVTIQITTVKEQ